ncbi:MAG: NgoFVII family restriction endonuclease [Candidatus Zambryskibacteria bacterium]|nr:NgoFVII family restriction endonuclease [Candidatus Zambryskibacteria bacterium]
MIYSNEDTHGGSLLDAVKIELPRSTDAAIASGYVSDDIVSEFEPEFYRIAENGGRFRLLVGMAFHEGLSAKKLKHLREVDAKLKSLSDRSGIFVCYSRRFHGKIYSFKGEGSGRAYVGSSNFSISGLRENLECNAEILDEDARTGLDGYIDYIFNQDNSVSIADADIAALGTDEYKKRIAIETLDDLERYDPETIDTASLQYFDYPLTRAASSEKSNLNAYFGKGRWSRATGKIKPRQWYEVELIAPREINSLSIYPQGEFTAFTSDGYVMNMMTSGDNYKNIRSTPKLTILGEWIKSKLQNSGVLAPLTPITSETLAKYGKDNLRFYKIEENKYYVEF